MRLLGQAWSQLRAFCAVEGDATYLWPRWIILRCVGLLFIVIFAGIIVEGRALIGPNGIAPLPDILDGLRQQYPNSLEAFFRAPGLFWLSASPGMVFALQWLGMISALALVFNVWPRLALFGCWLCFLSFVVLGHFFAQTQPDQLMLEVTLLCLALAPAGYLPGLGAKSPPRIIAVFALRFMLFRLMFEAGLSKFTYGSTVWRDLTAMDIMYQTAPFPTILGYLSHQLPHFFHVIEIGITFVAEIVAPLLMVFAGRRGRWFAFLVWAAFQLGIQVTNNFAWLNLGAIALAVILIDDQMLASAARWLRLRKAADYLAAKAAAVSAAVIKPWAKWGLRVALGTQMALALFFYAKVVGAPVADAVFQPVQLVFGGFRSANVYRLFANIMANRYEIEFMGSNDGGETWRSYQYRHKVQRVDRICSFVAPWYPRFEAILQNTTVSSNDRSLYQAVAAHLILRDAAVQKLFANDPFPGRPATLVRMPTYQFTFTDFQTWRATGNYWRKAYVGDYGPMMYVNDRGEITAGE